MSVYSADANRYQVMQYRKIPVSGLKLPLLSLGLWHNFGDSAKLENMREMLFYAFDHGITHFDLANNYGPPGGSAETNFGKLYKENLQAYRDELVISTKAGYTMWDGPYGDGGSRKYLISSLDRSLKRLQLDYVDIFYHHRMDTETPLSETMLALAQIVKSGKALYVGLSNYDAATLRAAQAILTDLKVPFIINQNRYSLLNRSIERNGFKETVKDLGLGLIVFSPLQQGILTERYLDNIPADSRINTDGRFLKASHLDAETMAKVRALKEVATARGQSLAAMSLAWLLRDETVTSVLIGASKVSQIADNLSLLTQQSFTAEELACIEAILAN